MFSFISLSSVVGDRRLLRAVLVPLTVLFIALPISSMAQLPISTGAPYVGQKAPGFTLPDQHGKLVSLAGLLRPVPGARKSAGVALVFYRGYW